MANPLQGLLQKKAIAEFPARAKWALTGLAKDFWADGSEKPVEDFFAKPNITGLKTSVMQKVQNGLALIKSKKSTNAASAAASVMSRPKPVVAALEPAAAPGMWHALPGEVAEKMWGDGFVLPGANAMLDMMLKPIAIDKQTEVLDLSAGLGAFIHKAAADFSAYATGLEPDPALAIRANEILVRTGRSKLEPIAYYTPDNFVAAKTVSKVYDCVLAREIFYRLQDKNKFFTAIAVSTKPTAQLTFTDYIVNPEDRTKPAITAWMEYEGNAAPLGLVEMAEAWAQAGFKLNVHDDQTYFYRREVLAGLQRFAKFLASGIRPDKETQQDILRRMELWTHRLAAMEQGLKFFRFYGTKETIGIRMS